MHAHQKNSNDQAEETNCASKDFDNENLHKECRVGCVRQSRTRSNLLNRNAPLFRGVPSKERLLMLTCPTQMPQTRLVSPVVRPAPNMAKPAK